MRGSRHNGRWGSERHNGRDFDEQKAPHIDPKRTSQNVYYVWDGGSIKGAELHYYEQTFGPALKAQNERHRKAGNLGRVRDMETWMQARQHRPEETIMQIGKMDDNVDPAKFQAALEDYVAWEQDWSAKHGRPTQIMDVALHLDEASPHAHIRRVWQYQDEAGTWHVGQNKALKAAGVELPDPSKPEGPKNNRKMTYDAMCRERWLDICEQHGFEMERTPSSEWGAHVPQGTYKAISEARRELDNRDQVTLKKGLEAAQRRQEVAKREKAVETREKDLDARESAIAAREKVQAAREADFQRKEDALEAQARALAAKIQTTRKLIDIGRRASAEGFGVDTPSNQGKNRGRALPDYQP